VTIENDPLEFFNSLADKRKKREGGDALYPGSTPPRNKVLDRTEDEWLRSLPFKEFLVAGEPRKFYSIGALATALGKQPVTLRSWEQKGWLPAASFRTPAPRGPQIPGKVTKGRRLYSQEQVVFLATAYDKYILSPRKPNWPGFRSHIKNQYPR
jgi:hypothetical protein